MKLSTPGKLNKLAAMLKAPLYVVGGVCRDHIAGLTPSVRDWDICAPAPAEEIKRVAEEVGFKVTATYKNTGTVRMSDGGEEYEYTSFRTDKYVRGEHSPVQVFFTDDIQKDARRRDFKCNAVYYDIRADKFVDPLGGTEDIKSKTISTVVDANKVFGEDGLRLMRLARIAAQTGFTPSRECLDGAIKNCALIEDIAAERIWAELNAILNADLKYGICGGQYKGLQLLNETGVLKIILPELALGDNMRQRKDFHSYDVLQHSLRCVLYARPQIRLAALLHDVGKPRCMIDSGKFALHEVEGERIARTIAQRLRVPKKLTERTCKLIRWHMYDLSGEASENKIRKFIVANGDIYEELLMLKQADFSACKDDASVAPCIVKWQGIYNKMLEEGVPMCLKQLNVKGDDLIRAGVDKQATGKTLAFLLSECAIKSVPNERERLIKLALSSQRNLR